MTIVDQRLKRPDLGRDLAGCGYYIGRVAQTTILLSPAVLTFVSAGTVHFWQGWLYWGTFLLFTNVTGIYLRLRNPALLERRMRAGPTEESRPLEKAVMTALLVVWFGLAIVPGLDCRFGWSRVPASVSVIADLIVVGSFVIFLLVLHENAFAASTVTVEPGQRVISTGLYAHVRHPMYTGGLLLLFATPVALGSWRALIISALSVPILLARIFDEERTLSEELAGYDSYRRAVAYRLIPLLW